MRGHVLGKRVGAAVGYCLGMVRSTIRAHDEGETAGGRNVRAGKEKHGGEFGRGDLDEDGIGNDGGTRHGRRDLIVCDATTLAILDYDSKMRVARREGGGGEDDDGCVGVGGGRAVCNVVTSVIRVQQRSALPIPRHVM